MGLIDLLSSQATDRKITKKLVDFIYDRVQNERGIRIEDAICSIATLVGERCIECAGEYTIDAHDFKPGSVIFSEKINEVLVGAVTAKNWTELPKESVFGAVKTKLEPTFNAQDFPDLLGIFKNHSENSGSVVWGNVPLSVPAGNKPSILPIRVAYETRGFVQKDINLWSSEKSLQISVDALVQILMDSKAAIASPIALLLAFETVNGVSKMATMTDKKMQELREGKKK